jgi:transcription antitermination factor NusG
VDAIGTIGAGNPDAGSNSVPDVVPRVEDKAEWFVLRTQSRHEKCVAERARSRQVESFLPLYRSVRYWKDRRKELELPLFPGYVFVRTSIAERRPILQVPGVLQFIT